MQKVRNDELLTEDEADVLTRQLNSHEMYFNEDNLRKAYRDRDLTKGIVDFIKVALGKIGIKTREQVF